jgi:hypothetical protein
MMHKKSKPAAGSWKMPCDIRSIGVLRFTSLRSVLSGLCFTVLFAGCFSDEPTDLPSGTLDGMTVQNDEAALDARVTDRSDTIAVDTISGVPLPKRSASSKTLTLTLIAEIAPPIVNGDTLQASSAALKGGYAYVSYNYRGEPYRGGVDIVQIKNESKAEITSQLLFNDADVHALHFDGSLYLATGTSNETFGTPAVLERVGVIGGKLELKARERVALNSFAANAVTVSGKQVFATSGSTGGLHVLSQTTLAGTVTSLDDARWVDYDDTRVVVAQGKPGRIAVYTKATMAPLNSWTFTGANIDESKTTVRVLGGKALIAAGTGGAQLMNLATGKIVGSVPVPVVAGVSADRSVANAADADKDLIYVSNGEAGVYAVEASSDLGNATGDNNITLTVLGKLRFSNLQSVNHVAFDGNTLVIAAGLGGVKIVTVKWQ